MYSGSRGPTLWTEQYDLLLPGKTEKELNRIDDYGYDKWKCEQVKKKKKTKKDFTLAFMLASLCMYVY